MHLMVHVCRDCIAATCLQRTCPENMVPAGQTCVYYAYLGWGF